MPATSTSPRVALSTIGWDAEWAALAAAHPQGTPGRVTRVDRGLCTVVDATGPSRVSLGGAVLEAAAREPVHAPCAGDWVMLRHWPDSRVTLETVLPRRTQVIRAEAGLRPRGQVLAANASVAAVTVALDQLPSLTKVERLLALAWDSGARPVVLLTKADSAADAADIAADVRSCAPGVMVLRVSAVARAGLSELRALVAGGGTLALTGPPSLCRRSPIGRRCTPGAARSLPCSLDADDVHDEICRIWWSPGTCGPSIGLRAKAENTGCERRSVSEPADTSRHQRHPKMRVPPHWV